MAEDFEMITYMLPSGVSRVSFMQNAKEGIFDEISQLKVASKIKSYKDQQRLHYLTSTKQVN